jgi:sulfite reductase (ferredoxin)
MSKDLQYEVSKDIAELRQKITAFRTGELHEDRFKHFRLTRGVYGQRQLGVHMFRTKIPYGKLTSAQLVRLADISEKYTNGNLHITTRQNIQMHYVKLSDAPAIWAELAEDGLTAREACGNTVRNLTASAHAGIDPDELFDVSPYVQAVFEYFLRNPICQDMGRKIKPAFSSSDRDSAYTFIHDFGFIPRLRIENALERRGFKVVVGGGLGAQSMMAQTAYEFLPTDQIIPFMEAALRVFDRYGEREKRHKARMKFLIQKIGLEEFMRLVEAERIAIKHQSYPIEPLEDAVPDLPNLDEVESPAPYDLAQYDLWLATNVVEQKQKGFYAVHVRVPLGNMHADTARALARLVKDYAADDIRLTMNQGILLKFLRPQVLPIVFNELSKLGLAKPGFDSLHDVTACPGTDTCNLAVTNSTDLAIELERVLNEDYPELIHERNLKIKISGCMNACGQHMAASIGLHGSSIKRGALVVPAMQVVLGGGVDRDGNGLIADKIVKVPTKKVPDLLRTVLDDYEANAEEGEYFNDYYARLGKMYFYTLLKPLQDLNNLSEDNFFDWGQDSDYVQAIGVGECAGVAFDMVGVIIGDAKEKIGLAEEALERGIFADSIYHSYSAFVTGAKALLLSVDVKCNTHQGIIKDFNDNFVQNPGGSFSELLDFGGLVAQINQNEPTEVFAQHYLRQAANFVAKVIHAREADLVSDKLVVDNYYKA